MEKKLIAPHKTTRTHHRSLISSIYAGTIFLSFHYFFVIYINSSFVGQYVPEELVGTLYILGAALNIFFFFLIPHILRKYGNYKVILGLVLIEMAVLLGLAFNHNLSFLVGLFIIHQSLPPLLLFSLDIFLESATPHKKTGQTRGFYLTMTNSVVVLSPFLVGLLLTHGGFTLVYFLSALFLVPFFLIAFDKFKQDKEPHYHDMHIKKTVSLFLKNKNVSTIFATDFLLHFFYACMVIYMPLYLSNVIGFTWGQIGIIFTIMLLPFVIFEIPLGRLADHKLGEKEILVSGFIIIALSTLLIPYFRDANFLAWALLLFVTRIGASFIEISSETYFFKQVKAANSDFISLYRSAIPLSYILAPFAASLLLLKFPFNTGMLFTMLGLVMFVGILISTRLKDTL